jgi:ketosteroid isomerase-like protein
MGHPHAELMRKASELLNAGDFPGFLALHTEDVVMHVPGNGPLSGDHRGQDRIAAVFQKEMELLDAPRSSSLTTTSEATTTSSHSSHRSFSEGAARSKSGKPSSPTSGRAGSRRSGFSRRICRLSMNSSVPVEARDSANLFLTARI